MNYIKFLESVTMLIIPLLIRGINRHQIFGTGARQLSLRKARVLILNLAEAKILELDITLDQLKFSVNFLKIKIWFR